MQSERPLAHLKGHPLLCSGWLSTWRNSGSGFFKELCVQGVTCRDWETGKKNLARLDHVWIRATANSWKILHQLGMFDGERTRRLDSILFVARPEFYRRTNGSTDWGLYLLSSTPTTRHQAQGVYQEFRKLSKPNQSLSNPAGQFQQFVITTRLLELRLEDWRLYSHQGPEHAQWVCRMARRNAEAGLRHQYSTVQLAKRAACIRHFCQHRADLILSGQIGKLAQRQQYRLSG